MQKKIQVTLLLTTMVSSLVHAQKFQLSAHADLVESESKNKLQQIVLPEQQYRQGIVINLPEKRLYYFSPDQQSVDIFPVAIGRTGWGTPLGKTVVVRKQEKPIWYVPKSIREDALIKKNKVVPLMILPGKDNPLGNHAIYLGMQGYLLHGTNDPGSIGQIVTHGCIRLHNKDIETLFQQVSVGTPVYIIHQPYKMGIFDNRIVIEIHRSIEHVRPSYAKNTTPLKLIIARRLGRMSGFVDEALINKTMQEAKGIPTIIGHVL